jgi:hypothetical protein
MNLRQQLLSFFPGNTLQFHTVWSFSAQHVIDKLIHTRPTGYFLCFFLLFGKLSCLKEMDDLLCPRRSLWLDNED